MTTACPETETETIFVEAELPDAPELSSISPSGALRGDTVTLTGIGLADVSQVQVGAAIADDFTRSASEIAFSVPANAENGIQEVRVLGPGGFSAALDIMIMADSIAPPPVSDPRVLVVVPDRLRPLDAFAVWGTNFGTDAQIRFGDVMVPTTRVDEFKLEAILPATVVNGAVVVISNERTSNQVAVEILFPPTVIEVTPLAPMPADILDVVGENLLGATASIIGAGAAPGTEPTTLALDVDASTDTLLRAQLPDDLTAGDYLLRIENANGDATITVTIFASDPTITGTKPFEVLAGNGLLIEGRGLADVTTVTVGGDTAEVTFADDRSIAVVVSTDVAASPNAPIEIQTPRGNISGTVGLTTEGSQALFRPAPVIVPTNPLARPGIDNLWEMEFQSDATRLFLQSVEGSDSLLTGELRPSRQTVFGQYDLDAGTVEIVIPDPNGFGDPERFTGRWARMDDENRSLRMALFSDATGDQISLVTSFRDFEGIGRCESVRFSGAVDIADSPFVGHFAYMQNDLQSISAIRTCAGNSTRGPEAAYTVTLAQGETLTARATSPTGTDLIVSFVNDPCFASTCFAGANDEGPGVDAEELVTYTNVSGVSDQTIYVIVEQSGQNPGGSYRLELSIQ